MSINSAEILDKKKSEITISRWQVKELLKKSEAPAVLLLIILCLILSLTTKTFLTVDNLIYIARGFSISAIVGMGMLLVLAAGGMDFSVGAAMNFAGIVAAYFVFTFRGIPQVVSILLGIGIGTLIGILNGFVITFAKLNPFIITMGTSYIAGGIVTLLVGGQQYTGFTNELKFLGQGSILGLPTPFWLMIVFMITWQWILTRTAFGKNIFAVGGNIRAARLSGVPVFKVNVSVYVISALMASIGGVLMTLRMGVGQNFGGSSLVFDIIAALVIGGASLAGGKGTIIGVVLGSVVMAVIRNGLILLGIGDLWQYVVIGLIIIFAVIVDQVRLKANH